MAGLPPLIRDYRDDDLGRVVSLWEGAGWLPIGPDGLRLEEATDLLGADVTETLVAERDGEIVGVAFGTATSTVGTVYRIVGVDGVPVRLLDELEGRLVDRGVRRMIAGVRGSPETVDLLSAHGYEPAEDHTVLEREIPATTAGPSAVEELGGRMVDPGLWSELKGMEEAKAIIERRVILPLAEPDLAARHGVRAPHAAILFGPPGTGKTTFAKGIASRLGWPFVPIEPARLGEQGAEQEAAFLAGTIEQVLGLPSAVAFVDEVEDIASTRDNERRVSPRVTTEFLRQIPRFRDSPHHLLVCATNWVGRLDPAILRPGRFDYVLPVGPPDDEARAAIWRRYVDEITDQEIDVDALVAASERFTPADIEFAANKAAQFAFEREYAGERTTRATTEIFLEVIGESRPTLTEEMIETFADDRSRYARY